MNYKSKILDPSIFQTVNKFMINYPIMVNLEFLFFSFANNKVNL